MRSQTRLTQALAELLERKELTAAISAELGTATLRELKAILAVIRREVGKRAAGAPPKYARAYLDEVQRHVDDEIARLKAGGAKRAGARTALRSLVHATVGELEGTHAIDSKAIRIDTVVDDLFLVYEAARKRKPRMN